MLGHAQPGFLPAFASIRQAASAGNRRNWSSPGGTLESSDSRHLQPENGGARTPWPAEGGTMDFRDNDKWAKR